MSNTNCTTKRSFKHLSDIERGQIDAYLKEGKRVAEIGRLLDCHRSAIKRELERGTVTQVKKLNKTKVYFECYFPEAGKRAYEENRSHCRFIKLEHSSTRFSK